ncbi:MAG: hypothetical protein WD025_08450 [Bacteriovoracaceae bacterium]
MIKKKLILILVLSACAQERPKKDFYTVELEGSDSRSQLIITDQMNADYGPSPRRESKNESTADSIAMENKKVLALDLYPALYHSLGYVSIFIELEKQGVKLDIVSSTGFTSIVAALYAKYGSANMLEWKTFELYQLLGSKKPFSDDWRQEIEDFLKKEFGTLKLNQLKKLFILPSLVEGRIHVDTDRKVISALMEAIDLSEKTNMLLGNNYDYLGQLKKYGADQVYRVSFLPGKIELKRPNGYVFGIYSRLQGASKNFSESPNIYLYKDALKGSLDVFHNLSDALDQTRDESAEFTKVVKKHLKKTPKTPRNN